MSAAVQRQARGPAAWERHRVVFGGPDRPRALRDLLERHVEAVPAGGEIVWATYYFRDERLAEALVRARRRGVDVKVTLEAAPRERSANAAVIRQLSADDGLGEGFKAVRQPLFGHLHEKLYAFSHPEPHALVGTFNPSGNTLDDPEIVRRIGDQDRGHNLLVEIRGPEASALIAHARRLHARPPGLIQHLAEACDPPVQGRGFTAYFFPRRRNPLDDLFAGLAAGSRLRIAMSHLGDRRVACRLAGLVRRGVEVELITEATRRRVPGWIERSLSAAGARFRRYEHPDGLPMHNKFLLAEGDWGRWAVFGSFNLTRTSRWLNREILVVTCDAALFAAFASRWDEISAELSSLTLSLVA